MNAASYNAGHAAGTLIGVLLFIAVPIVLGAIVARRINRERGYGESKRWPIVMGASISAFLLLGYCGQQAPAGARVTETNNG